ncbi:UDP-N-acetylmuramate dehydrogenase [Candidatus Saccharibacteria bacterium TM7i]|nr:UDP-N-acetylmuramate dehydrogenase [Candidatus Saccharibacteria bacterium TM7i]
MDIRTNIPLKNFTTMRLGGPARFFADAHSPAEAQALYRNAKQQQLPVFILGGGSNLLARDEGFDGLVIRMRILGFEVIADDLNTTTIKVGAGEIWDSVVERTVSMNLSGIEAMSAIPGTAGAAPVQNVGAYGQEIAETLISLEAYDTQNDAFAVLQNEDCNFSYRHSIFRGDQQGRYIITSITLQLSKSLPAPPFYDTLQSYLDANNISFYTQQTIRDAVKTIRAEKLPDPTVIANSGSFFKNSIIDAWRANELRQNFPDIKMFEMADGRMKVPSGWLIEKAGLKGSVSHGIRVYEKNALVLVNEAATGYQDLAAAREEIISKVRDTFQVIIEQEPLEITA